MLPEFLSKLKTISPLSPSSEALIEKIIYTEKISKHAYILKQDKICNDIYYLQKGYARIYYYKNGKEITEWFAKEKHFCFSIKSYFEDLPSDLIIQTLEECEVIYLPKKKLEQLQNTNLEVSNLVTKMFSLSLIHSQKRIKSIQFETAKQRYENLITENPLLTQKVPLQDIASYLGITKETLSRIRAKI